MKGFEINYNNQKKHKWHIIAITCLCLLGCGKSDPLVYRNKTFEDMSALAKKRHSFFCVVLSDSTLSVSKEYLTSLQQHYQYLTTKAIYNVADVNIPDNEWYFKWLMPETLPLTCIFSSDGTLVDIIPGIAKETFLYTDLAIKEKSATDYHYPNHFNLSKERLLPLMDNILKQRLNINQHVFLSVELDKMIDSLHYPYPYYLKMTGELMKNDTIAARNTAKLLLDIESSYYLEIFKNEYIIAKSLLDPSFDIADEPRIRVDRKIINLSKCVANQKVPIDVVVHNDGNKPLKISDIQMSCSCVELEGNNKQFNVLPKDSCVVKFNFSSNVEGHVSRDIVILSDDINSPILNINIQADVLK